MTASAGGGQSADITRLAPFPLAATSLPSQEGRGKTDFNPFRPCCTAEPSLARHLHPLSSGRTWKLSVGLLDDFPIQSGVAATTLQSAHCSLLFIRTLRVI